MRTIAITGCRVAAMLIVAAVALWIINAPRTYFNDRFCAEGSRRSTQLWNRSYLRAPADERCDVVVGPRTVAAGMAAGGVVAMAVFSIPLWLPRRRSKAETNQTPGAPGL